MSPRPNMCMRLNLGCGDDVRPGWVNVDIVAREGVEVLDLEEFPWPYDTGSAERILASNVFEHIAVENRAKFIEECLRVLEPGGLMEMRLPVPEIGAGWDLTHHPVPSWRWPYHPRWSDLWDVIVMEGKTVGPGRFVPENVARLATRFWIFRGVDEVTIAVTPK